MPPRFHIDETTGCAVPDAGYICPVCELSVFEGNQNTAGIDFFFKPRLLDRPICEVCAIKLHYLLIYPPDSVLHPLLAVLVKLAVLRDTTARDLAIQYVREELEPMLRPRAFKAHYQSKITGLPRREWPKRRPEKRKSKEWRDHLSKVLDELLPSG